jgi:hypothetical protein
MKPLSPFKFLVIGNIASIVVGLVLFAWGLALGRGDFVTFFAGGCTMAGVLGLLMARAAAVFWKAAQREFAFDMACMEETARLRVYNGTKDAFAKLRAEGIVTDALTPDEFIEAVGFHVAAAAQRRGSDGPWKH